MSLIWILFSARKTSNIQHQNKNESLKAMADGIIGTLQKQRFILGNSSKYWGVTSFI